MQIKLSISVLVSDRAETVSKCLNSLVPILQNIPSELIVVFTGKSSESLDIAKKYTDHIIPFEWCDDFSKARNIGLSEASGEWFMFIDDDEWFENSTEIIDFFQNIECETYTCACYTVRNYFDLEGVKYSDTFAPRIIKRSNEVKFQGLIHEALTPWNGPTKYFKCFVHHYGYAKKDENKEKANYDRNITLLEKQIQIEPENIRYYAQLVQEFYGAKEYEKAENYCRKILELDDNKWSNNYVQWAAVFLAASFAARDKMEQALDEGKKLLSSNRLSGLYQLFLYIYITPPCFKLMKYEEGIRFAEEFTRLFIKMDEEPGNWNEQQLLDINRENALRRSYYVYTNAVLCASYIGDFKLAAEFLKKFEWDSDYKQNEKYHFFNSLKEIFPAQYETLLSAFAAMESENIYVTLQKALYFEVTGHESESKKLYFKCQAEPVKIFAYPLIFMALRNGYALPCIFKELDLEDWRECAQSIAVNIAIENYPLAMGQTEAIFVNFPIQKMVLQQKILAKVLFDTNLAKTEFLRILTQYCDIVLALNKIIYREELFEISQRFCLPKECRVVIELQNVLHLLHHGEVLACVEKLKELIGTHVELSYIARTVTDYLYEDYSEIMEKSRNQEFYETGEKVKTVMKQLADNEQYKEALHVAEELGVLMPEDSEIVKYKQLLRKMIE